MGQRKPTAARHNRRKKASAIARPWRLASLLTETDDQGRTDDRPTTTVSTVFASPGARASGLAALLDLSEKTQAEIAVDVPPLSAEPLDEQDFLVPASDFDSLDFETFSPEDITDGLIDEDTGTLVSSLPDWDFLTQLPRPTGPAANIPLYVEDKKEEPAAPKETPFEEAAPEEPEEVVAPDEVEAAEPFAEPEPIEEDAPSKDAASREGGESHLPPMVARPLGHEETSGAEDRREALKHLYAMKVDKMVAATPDWFSHSLVERLEAPTPSDDDTSEDAGEDTGHSLEARAEAVQKAASLIIDAQTMPEAVREGFVYSPDLRFKAVEPDALSDLRLAGPCHAIDALPPPEKRLVGVHHALNAFYGPDGYHPVGRLVGPSRSADAEEGEASDVGVPATTKPPAGWNADLSAAHSLFLPDDVARQGPVTYTRPALGPTYHSSGFERADTSATERAVVAATRQILGQAEERPQPRSPLLKLGADRQAAKMAGSHRSLEETRPVTPMEQLKLMEGEVSEDSWLGPQGTDDQPSGAEGGFAEDAAQSAFNPTVLVEAADGRPLVDAARSAAAEDAALVKDDIRARRAAENRGDTHNDDEDGDGGENGG